MMRKNKHSPLTAFLFTTLILHLLDSCALQSSNTAVLWTDKPEFALYAEYFNANQDIYKIETRYFESPAQKLTDNDGSYPDIVVGSWLKSAATRNLFQPLDSFFKKNQISRESFYPPLLALGNIDGKQYLLPVAFNIPALVFSRDKGTLLSNPFTISLEEIREIGKTYNIESNGIYSRMGFSPAWNDDFIFVSAVLFGASFREASPLEWDSRALEGSLSFIQDWIQEANTSIQAEDDFSFKYFYDPPAKLAQSGRILFFHMGSSEFFTLPQERRASLDFRWIAGKDTIPLSEDMVYYGIFRNSRAKKAAEAFTEWFFKEETQRLFLEAGKNNRLNETRFGIANGFSALRTVTERIFPQFYPSLLGRMPPETFLTPPNILPRNWMAMKERVILPYLHDRIRSANQGEIRSLDRRLTDWARLNRGL
ncbi:putative lipoprotein [Treponema primitia ZAS-2]|uniref:Putative lipoprotein n=1 Tax=Treponema primitia (strain ATCC BAA-887 / DSM 12427 / ZAS-2) TaxID=545694 RepID=F5YMQ9_TREPZ|nr:extracellular solute-binding protein [Treponema primitia]AEF86181.1 putative lipoprotein [Treponema primitia ZAS-2]